MPILESLPLFPLELVLYPHERLPLHIFEDRYKEMAGHCLETDSPFGIVLIEDELLAEIGCTARITEVLERYEDGRLDILIEGEDRFRVRSVLGEEPFITAAVDLIEEPEESSARDLQERVITQHMRLLELAGRTVRPSLYQDVLALSYVIAPNAGLTALQKQAVLELLTENQRIQFLIDHLETFIPRVEQMGEVRRKIQSNGHFKDFPPEG